MQVASSSDPNPASAHWQADAAHSPHADRGAHWPAGPADDTPESAEAQASSRQASDAQQSTSFPPRLPGLLTSHDRNSSEELTLQGTESSRASSRIPAHSVLSRMLQESSSHGAGAEEDKAAAYSLPPDMLQPGMMDAAAATNIGRGMVYATVPAVICALFQVVDSAILIPMHRSFCTPY